LTQTPADTKTGSISVGALAAGMVTAFAVGLLSLLFLLKLIKRGKLGLFAYYLIPAGIFVLTAVGMFHI